jgi:hypothetical protein
MSSLALRVLGLLGARGAAGFALARVPEPGLDTESPALCGYATEPHTRPDYGLTPVVAFGATRLCAACAARRSTLGKGQRPRPLQAPEIDVLTWLAAAVRDLRAARHALHAAVRRARQRGHSWQTIGDQLGISRQAAQQRFSQQLDQDLLDGLEPWGVYSVEGQPDTP